MKFVQHVLEGIYENAILVLMVGSYQGLLVLNVIQLAQNVLTLQQIAKPAIQGTISKGQVA